MTSIIAPRSQAPTEREFQRQVMELAELCGWETLHVRTSMQQGRYLTATTGTMAKGWPDLFMVRERDGRRLAIELKSERGRITPDQTRVTGVLEAADIECYFWRPSDWPTIVATLSFSAGLATGKEPAA